VITRPTVNMIMAGILCRATSNSQGATARRASPWFSARTVFSAIGWHDDAPGPFESRAFAEAVARELAR